MMNICFVSRLVVSVHCTLLSLLTLCLTTHTSLLLPCRFTRASMLYSDKLAHRNRSRRTIRLCQRDQTSRSVSFPCLLQSTITVGNTISTYTERPLASSLLSPSHLLLHCAYAPAASNQKKVHKAGWWETIPLLYTFSDGRAVSELSIGAQGKMTRNHPAHRCTRST